MIRAVSSRVRVSAARPRAAASLSKQSLRTAPSSNRPLFSHSAAAATVAARGDDSRTSWSTNSLVAAMIALGSIAASADQVCVLSVVLSQPK